MRDGIIGLLAGIFMPPPRNGKGDSKLRRKK